MKLDRNINQDGKGKYALIKLRETTPVPCEFTPDYELDDLRIPSSAVGFGHGAGDWLGHDCGFVKTSFIGR